MTFLTIELVVIVILILLNGVLAMAEIAIVSARKIRLQQMARGGVPGAQAALSLASEPSHFLSTVQIGITLVGILTGAFGGATLAEELGAVLSRIPLLQPYAETIGVLIVVLLITYLSLVFGELAPKQIGLANAEKIASGIAPAMQVLSKAAAPVVRLLSYSTAAVLRVIGFKKSVEPEVTEEEIKIMIQQGTESGVLEPIEEEMVDKVFRLSDQRIHALMTPRFEITWIDIDDPIEIIQKVIVSSSFSAFPVGQGTVDNVLGIVRARDLLEQCFVGQPIDLKTVLQQALVVPESTPVFDALDRFRENKTQMALAIDEFGGIQGLVTTTDILEAIAGDFPDLQENTDPDIVQREDGSWLLDGMISTEKFKELFSILRLPEEAGSGYQTLGGFVMSSLGRTPKEGDTFEWESLEFEVLDMDGNRVDKVLVTVGDAKKFQ